MTKDNNFIIDETNNKVILKPDSDMSPGVAEFIDGIELDLDKLMAMDLTKF
jgi:hypothetical protein